MTLGFTHIRQDTQYYSFSNKLQAYPFKVIRNKMFDWKMSDGVNEHP